MRTKTSSSSDLLLALPADAYGFRRAGSTESTETVRPGKLDLLPHTVLESISQAEDLIAQSVYGLCATSSFSSDDDDEVLDDPTTMTEDRLPMISPKKTPPTPPRYGDDEGYEVMNLTPPSAVQQPRLARNASPFVLKPRKSRTKQQASIFRASPLLDGLPPSRQHGGFYALKRSPAFDEDQKIGGGDCSGGMSSSASCYSCGSGP